MGSDGGEEGGGQRVAEVGGKAYRRDAHLGRRPPPLSHVFEMKALIGQRLCRGQRLAHTRPSY